MKMPSAIKMLFPVLVLFFTGCASTSNLDNIIMLDTVGVNELTDVVNLYYTGCEVTEQIIADSLNIAEAARNIFSGSVESYIGHEQFNSELKNLTTEELFQLVGLYRNYSLGRNKDIYISVCTAVLFGLKAGKSLYKKSAGEN